MRADNIKRACTAKLRSVAGVSDLHPSVVDVKIFTQFTERAAFACGYAELSGEIVYANPALCRMLDFNDRRELIGHRVQEFYTPELLPHLETSVLPTVLRLGEWVGRISLMSRKGRVTQCMQNIFLVGVGGKPAYYANVITDLSELEAAQEAIRCSQRMVSLGDLCHRIAHDFAGVLVRIISNADLAKSELGNPEYARRLLDRIIDSANAISSLTAQLLAFAHPVSPDTRLTELSKIIGGMRSIVESAAMADVKVEFKIEADCVVCVDRAQIEQAVMHLVVNALESMEGTSGKLTLMTSIQPDGRFINLEVIDTGRGMDEETRNRMFDPFYTTKKDSDNRGLGMPICYNIIAQHGGRIEVSSVPGQGTTVRICLPVAGQ